MNTEQKTHVIILLVFLCFFIPSCHLVGEKKLLKAQASIKENYLKEIQKQEEKRPANKYETLSWNEALHRMYLQNSSCKRAEFSLQDAKQRQKGIWKQFIPGFNIGIIDSFEVGDLSTAFTDPSLRINSFLALGNLLNLPKNIYERKLYVVGAELAEQLTMRQQIISLYRLFEEMRLLELERKGLNIEIKLAKTSNLTKIDTEAKLAKSLEKKKLSWQTKKENLNSKVATFFSSYPGKIELEPTSMPYISYSSKKLDFRESDRWGKLQLKILALKELGEQGRLTQAYLRYLPRASLGVNAPPLYSNSSSQGFQAENIRINPSLNWSLDTRGLIGEQIRRLKRNKPLEKWEKDRRRRDEVRKLLEGRKMLAKVENQLSKTKKLQKEYTQLIKKGLISNNAQKNFTNFKKLYQKQVELRAQKIEISSEFWLLDEAYWSKFGTPWKIIQSQEQKRKKALERQKKAKFLKIDGIINKFKRSNNTDN